MDDKQVDTVPESVPSEPGKPTRRRRSGWLIALVVIIIVLVGAWFGWQWWQQQRADVFASQQQTQQQTQQKMQALTDVQSDVGALSSKITALNTQTQALGQRINASASTDDGLSQQLQGVAQRTTQLEGAVAKLSQQRLSGRDASLVDDTAMLLRLGQQRYVLFHDTAAASQAFTLAAQTLGAVNDPAFASVRQSISSEREALAATHPAARIEDLASLQRLRGHWSNLPLKSLDNGADAQPRTTWQRVWHALSTLVKIDHYNAQLPDARYDPAMARKLARLDLAQAQASLLAADMPSYRIALQLVQSDVADHFDRGDAGVRKAEATLKHLLDNAAAETTPVQLGAALRELENLRAVHGVAPNAADESPPVAPAPPAVPPAAASVPAPASSAAASGGNAP